MERKVQFGDLEIRRRQEYKMNIFVINMSVFVSCTKISYVVSFHRDGVP